MIMIRLVQKQNDYKARKYWTEEIKELPSGIKFAVKTKVGGDLEVYLNYSEIAEVVKSDSPAKESGSDYDLEKINE